MRLFINAASERNAVLMQKNVERDPVCSYKASVYIRKSCRFRFSFFAERKRRSFLGLQPRNISFLTS